MSERDDVPFEKPVAEMSRTEILAVFEAYGFADAMGHRLTMGRHFSELVELAAGRGGVKVDLDGRKIFEAEKERAQAFGKAGVEEGAPKQGRAV